MTTSLSNKISSIQEAVSAVLLESLAKPSEYTVYNKIATVVPTTAKTVNLPIGLPLQKMSEQIAESQTMAGVDNDMITVTTKRFSQAISINIDDLNDNTTSQVIDLYSPRLRELTQMAAEFYDQLIIDYLVSNPTTFTGEALFANSQTWGRGATAQDNLLGLALDETNLALAITTLRTFKDHLNQPIRQSGRINLIVPPQLEYTAKKLVAATSTYGGPNTLAGVADVVVSNLLTDANDWYLSRGSDQLLIVERMAPEVKVIEDEKAESVMVKVKLRAAPAVGVWSSFIKSVQ